MIVSIAAASMREALAAATDALAAAGVQTPRLDAELLLAEATGFGRADLAAHPDAGVEPAAARAFGEMVRRRLRREPVAYIVGRKGFRGIEVAVDPRVLIPRPETELLVKVAVERAPRTVLDVGTGSGAVALAVADELPDARVTATDLSIAALEVARGTPRASESPSGSTSGPARSPPTRASSSCSRTSPTCGRTSGSISHPRSTATSRARRWWRVRPAWSRSGR